MEVFALAQLASGCHNNFFIFCFEVLPKKGFLQNRVMSLVGREAPVKRPFHFVPRKIGLTRPFFGVFVQLDI